MGSIAIYGWFELKQREAYAAGAAGLPRNSSPSNPQTPSKQRPLLPPGNRQLTADQQRILITEGANVYKVLTGMLITYLDTDMEGASYASQLKFTLARAAIQAGVSAQPLGDPKREGIM